MTRVQMKIPRNVNLNNGVAKHGKTVLLFPKYGEWKEGYRRPIKATSSSNDTQTFRQ